MGADSFSTVPQLFTHFFMRSSLSWTLCTYHTEAVGHDRDFPLVVKKRVVQFLHRWVLTIRHAVFEEPSSLNFIEVRLMLEFYIFQRINTSNNTLWTYTCRIMIEWLYSSLLKNLVFWPQFFFCFFHIVHSFLIFKILLAL